jgi:hypothetical protein
MLKYSITHITHRKSQASKAHNDFSLTLTFWPT